MSSDYDSWTVFSGKTLLLVTYGRSWSELGSIFRALLLPSTVEMQDGASNAGKV
jgi:hypothetical protein